jgi:hypothetical protein
VISIVLAAEGTVLDMPYIRNRRELFVVFSSLLLQLPLAYFLGHYYDQRVFLATGYMVGSGLNPYQPHVLAGVFPNPLLDGTIPIVGYSPPWPLLLGLIYSLTFKAASDLLLYNFATKVPVICGNIALAFVVRRVLAERGVAQKKAQAAWLFLLFNPFILLTTSAWGQFDTVPALLCIVSLYLLSRNRIEACAVALAVSVSLKPIALAVVPLPLLFRDGKQSQRSLRYGLVFATTLLACWVAPFFLLRWSIPASQSDLTSYFALAGGISPFNLIEIFLGIQYLPQSLWFLGYLWLPSLLVGYCVVFRHPPSSLEELVSTSLGLTLIFFLTRSWLSEPNINLVLALMVMALAFGRIGIRSLRLAWIAPLAYLVLNTSFSLLFFLVDSSILVSLADFDQHFRAARLVARFAATILWQVVAWRVAVKVLTRTSPKG